MLLSLVPAMGVTASAADGFVEVSTYEQLENEVKKGEAKVKLVANIDTTNDNGGAGVTNQTALTFFGNNNILDLNGHTLKLVSNTGTTFINVNKDLTIQDSGTGGRIDFVYGPSVMHRTTAIYVSHASNEDIAHLTVKSGTLSSTKGGITLIESIGNLTINGGKFYAPYEVGSGGTYAIHTIHQYNDNAKTIITGGEIDGVVFIQRTDSAATGTPNYGDIPVQIKGGTFKQHMQLRWTENGEPSGYPTEFSPAVEIAGGIFEKRINPIENGVWGRSLSTKLTGGTFKDYTSFGLGKGDSTGTDYKYYLKSLGNSIIMRGNEIRTSCDWSEADWFNVDVGSIYAGISLDGSESNPVTVIPNAWGMKSVTLDDIPIDYFKDWKGTVERMDNSTAHTLKFEWYPLAQELKDAGYSYRANFDGYTVGSNTPTTSVPISATATEYSHTIPAGAAPSVYPFDLQLNLDKNGSSVGIIVNQHIVRISLLNGINTSRVKFSDVVTVDKAPPTANAAGFGYTVDSIGWFTDSGCSTQATAFTVGTPYYAKVVLKSSENHMFVNGKDQGYPVVIPLCEGDNDNYSIVGRPTISDSGKTLTFVAQSTAIAPFVWESVDTANVTHTIGSTGVELHAKAVGGDVSQYRDITYKLYTQKNGETTVAKSATTQGEFTPVFRPAEVGVYRCWFEATRGFDTITSTPFTVTVSTPGLSITNQSGDFTIMQGGYARLFVIAKNASNYQWQVKNGGSWTDLPGKTDHDYRATPEGIGKHIYRCKLTNRYDEVAYSNEMTVTVLENETLDRTPVYILPAINEAAPNPAALWPDKVIGPFDLQGQTSKNAEYTVTAGSDFQAEAFYSVIPGGEGYIWEMPSGTQMYLYYNSYEEKQYTAVLGEITYKWEATSKVDQEGFPTKYTEIGTEPTMAIPIPEGVGTYWAKLTITNTIGTGSNAKSQKSYVEITFHVDQPGADTAVSGTAVSWNDSNDALYYLYPYTTEDAAIRAEWKNDTYASGAALYTGTGGAITATTVDGKAMQAQTFSFGTIPAGEYKLVIFKPKKYVPKIVPITVESTALDLGQLKLWLYGDVNYDGKIRTGDATQINLYLAGERVFSDDEFASADITGDGKIRTGDVTQIYLKLSGDTSKFDDIK